MSQQQDDLETASTVQTSNTSSQTGLSNASASHGRIDGTGGVEEKKDNYENKDDGDGVPTTMMYETSIIDMIEYDPLLKQELQTLQQMFALYPEEAPIDALTPELINTTLNITRLSSTTRDGLLIQRIAKLVPFADYYLETDANTATVMKRSAIRALITWKQQAGRARKRTRSEMEADDDKEIEIVAKPKKKKKTPHVADTTKVCTAVPSILLKNRNFESPFFLSPSHQTQTE